MTTPIDPAVRIGHVHLKVSDLDRALSFYCGVLGLELRQRYGSQAAFVSAGGYHHHIGLNTWESAGGSPPPTNCTGLFHLAILYPTRATLADALRRLTAASIPLDGASDHGGERGALPTRPRRERRRTLLGSSKGIVAERTNGRGGNVHASARSRRLAARIKRQTISCCSRAALSARAGRRGD